MKISLVIPAYNEENYIGACLDHAIRHSGGRLHEIIVIDNASTDGTGRAASGRAGVRVVRESRKGLTIARQRGLEEATGDLIAYIDADTRMPAGWLAKLERAFDTRPGMVCLSGPYRYYDGSKWKNLVMSGIWWLSAPLTYRLVGYMVLGGNFVAKRSALVSMGGFDQSISFYGEDTDIARRISTFGRATFDMAFYMPTSSRRISGEGLIRTNMTYALNFIWPVLFRRPFTKKYRDIRLQHASPKD